MATKSRRTKTHVSKFEFKTSDDLVRFITAVDVYDTRYYPPLLLPKDGWRTPDLEGLPVYGYGFSF